METENFPPIDLELVDGYHGAHVDSDLFALPVFQIEGAFHGATGDTDFTAFPPINLDQDAYHGATGDGHGCWRTRQLVNQ